MSQKRIRLGLIFTVNEGWIGGTYYILNLISALGKLPEEKQPVITILSKSINDYNKAKETNYPYLNFVNPYTFKRNLVEKILNKCSKIFFKKVIFEKRISNLQVDILFPAVNEYAYELIRNKIYWIPDFQHILFPDLFNKAQVIDRDRSISEIAAYKNNLILSSKAAKSDWDRLGIEKKANVFVIPFAVTHPQINLLSIENLLAQYGLQEKYIIVSNQFWVHKNHFVVLKAALILKKKSISFQFVFTGSTEDTRQPNYYQSILDFINDNNLNQNIKILGLIERTHQLKLMQHAQYVLQPSLFEGWSTVIEDAKCLNKHVIASNISVHVEQLGDNATFFNPSNELELADKIQHLLNNDSKSYHTDYNKNVVEFGQQFFEVLDNLNKNNL